MRLGKQRVEVYQLLTALTSGTSGWQKHPCTRMWRGHEKALAVYGAAVCEEWIRRGYKDSLMPRMIEIIETGPRRWRIDAPAWFGEPAFHASHRSNLLRKDPVFYGTQGWSEAPDLAYVWPDACTHLDHDHR